MKLVSGLLAVGVVSLAVAAVPQAQDDKPEWAYAVAPGQGAGGGARGGGGAAGGQGGGRGGARAGGGAPADETKYTLPGSKFSFTRAEVRNGFGPADWFPEDHPPMPEVVSHGRPPDARACGFCHMPNGKGRPENAPVAGLPKEYIVQQLEDFKSGVRVTAEPRKPNDMTLISQRITRQDMEDAATYFASMKWTPWIRVVETDVVKKTRIAGQMYHLVDDGTTEPIGVRIVEAPENEDEEQLRAPRTGFVAYVPTGAIKRGEAIATTGGGKAIACVTCHGPTLAGVGPIPGLAGRSPSYLARQMYDIKQGARNSPMATLMKPVVAALTQQDIVDVFAYIASRMP
jgi:cytochrome c553